jgi:hypothetical protein
MKHGDRRFGLSWGLGRTATALLFLAACGTPTYAFRGNSIDPSADGFVKVDPGPNGNLEVKVRVTHVAPPQRLDPNAITYVVWVRPVEGEPRPQNVGALNVGDGERGELDTVTSLRHFVVFITVEQSPNPESPSAMRVLETRVDQP